MKLEGVTERCSRLWEQGAVALIGISPFNSYFSSERISEILRFCERNERSIALFIPDGVTRYTLQARGYSPKRAARKTRRQVQYLRNKIARAAGSRKLRIWGCEELRANTAYAKHHAALCRAFETDRDFRQGSLDTTRWVLAASEQENIGEPAALLGVRYLLAELPLFLHAPEILGEEAVVFVYHQCPIFITAMYRDPDQTYVSPGQGFGVLRLGDRRDRSDGPRVSGCEQEATPEALARYALRATAGGEQTWAEGTEV